MLNFGCEQKKGWHTPPETVHLKDETVVVLWVLH